MAATKRRGTEPTATATSRPPSGHFKTISKEVKIHSAMHLMISEFVGSDSESMENQKWKIVMGRSEDGRMERATPALTT